MIYTLVLTNILTFFSLAWLVRKHLGLLEKFDNVVEQIEESLDVIDSSYNRMANLLETPVLLDDPIVVELVQSAKNTKDSLLLVANKIIINEDSNQ
jgi:hypothetical protein